MGVPDDLAGCAIRVSLGPTTTKADIEKFLAAWTKLAANLSKGRRGIAA
jgi:cysteine desulfurase